MAKLLEVPGLRLLLPFVRSIYSQPSRYVWQDEAGNLHEIRQHEGGEQGDPLMPVLFSLAIHNALNEAKQEMLDGKELFAFLDDVYIVSSLERTRHLYNLVGEKLWYVAGIQLHTGKTRCWNQNGRCPPDMVEPTGSQGVGNANRVVEFIKEVGDRRLEEEQRLLATLLMRMGGLGFRSAERMAPSAFWASWADALPMIADRLPQVAAHVVGAVTMKRFPRVAWAS